MPLFLKILISLAVVALILLLLWIGFALGLFFYALKRPKSLTATEENFYKELEDHGRGDLAKIIRDAMADVPSIPYEPVYITAYDGIRLFGRFYTAEKEAKRTILLVHGFHTSALHNFSCVMRFYLENGSNLLLIDQRAHGESEGGYICFGTKERFDVLRWCQYLEERLGSDHTVILDGVSMGCTSSLLAAALPELPKNVKGVIADCGFSSAEEEFRHVIRRNFHLPPEPITWLADKFSRRFAGFGFQDVSTLTEVPKITIPVLFVHGEKDTFVPTENTQQNYNVCLSPKRMVIVPEAAHGTSYLVEREKCTQEILRFIAHVDDPDNHPFGD